MWRYQNIIQLELGEQIIKAANSPDNRGLFLRIFGSEPVDDAKLIIEGISHIRNELSLSNVHLPPIKIYDNQNIKGNEFLCYWGVEIRHYSISNLNELFDFIRNKAIAYHSIDNSRESIRKIHNQNIDLIKSDEFQYAYDNYIKTYFHSYLMGYEYEVIQSLAEIAGLLLNSGQLDNAHALLSTASSLCDNPNIIDPILKCQVYLNLAGVLKGKGLLQDAFNCFSNCANVSFSSENPHFLFFAQLGMAECHALSGNFSEAIGYYESSERLILNSENSDYRLAHSIQKEMLNLYRCLIECQKSTLKKQETSTFFNEFIKKVAISIGSALIQTAIFKVFKIKGTSSFVLFSLGKSFNFKEPVFNAPSIIGDYGKQNIN